MNGKIYKECAKDLMKFLDASPSAYHGIANVKKRLRDADFIELREQERWELKGGCGYFVVRNDASIMAFRIPKGKKLPDGFHIIAAHGDSPTFQIKENPVMQVEGKYQKLNVEGYGGMLISTWFDRPLSVAGRVVVETEAGLETRLVAVDKDLLMIPSVAIHMNREANKGYSYNIQQDCLPLLGMVGGKRSFGEIIAKAAGVKETDILGSNLFLYNRQKAALVGANEEFVASGRLDDLQCVYGGMQALLETEDCEKIAMLVVFDNEEVGSGTRQGADSTFLEDCLERIVDALGGDRETYLTMIADSFLVSADNAHAVHPNQPQLCDPTNRPVLNGGIVLKFHGGQRYATDAYSAARIRQLCKKADVPCQTFANRSDMVGGSTLGNISTAHVSLPSADIGLPQLAMHSAYETAGVKDTWYYIAFAKEFYQS